MMATASEIELSQPGLNLARFWERRGERVFEQDGIFWAHKKGPFYMSLPFDRALDVGPRQAAGILRKAGVLGIRFPAADGRGIASGLYVLRPADYSLQSVSRKQRGQVRQGLENCEIRLIDADELAAQGLELNQETLERHGRSDEMFLNPRQWKQFARAVGDSPGMLAWGAFFEARLSTYIVGCRDAGWLHLLYKASRNADMAQYTNHALDFHIASTAAADPGIRMISNGTLSLAPNEGLDRYKRHMGYSVLEQNHAIHFHPLFAPFLSTPTAIALSQAAAARFSRNKQIFYFSRVTEGSRMSREPNQSDNGCQQEDPSFSRLARPGSLFPILRVAQTFRQGGIGNTLRRAADFIRRRIKRRPSSPAAPRPLIPEEMLGLQPGEWVEVKSGPEILATLDSRSKNRGLLFTAEMMRCAGQRFRVHKRVESIFLEESKQRRTIRNTVLLEQSYCDGKAFKCDRSCFLFWKEAWLRRVQAP
ncbi:MAG TPA: hypothetical protein VGL72_16535 [Bryobacteraceae bacterium]|jgi:hypothetical protein